MDKIQLVISEDQNTIECIKGEQKVKLSFVESTNSCGLCMLSTVVGFCQLPCKSGNRKDFKQGYFAMPYNNEYIHQHDFDKLFDDCVVEINDNIALYDKTPHLVDIQITVSELLNFSEINELQNAIQRICKNKASFVITQK